MTERRHFFLSILILFFILSSHSMYSQGIFLDHGQSGLQLDGIYTYNKDAHTIGGGAGYSVNGIFDIQFAALKMHHSESYFGIRYNTLILAPGVAYHIRKQSDKVPVSLVGSIAYGYYKFSSVGQVSKVNEADGSSLNAGLYLFRQFKPETNFSVIPGLGVSYSNTKFTVPNNSGGSEELIDNYFTISVSVPLAYYLPKGQAITFTPEVAYGNRISVFYLSVGLVIPSATFLTSPEGEM